jgi:hypothetical protein
MTEGGRENNKFQCDVRVHRVAAALVCPFGIATSAKIAKTQEVHYLG